MFFDFADISVVNSVQHISFVRPFLDSLPLGVLIADTDGRVLYCNKAQARIDDMSVEYIEGKTEAELYGPYVGPGIMRSCQETGKPILGFVCHYRTVKGRIVNGAYWVYPLFNEGKVVASLCLTQPLHSKGPLFLGAKHMDSVRLQEATLPAYFTDSNDDKDSRNKEPMKIVGSNKIFRRMLSVAETTASSPSPVMICGETGCGKEMVAKAIRAASNRNSKPYMAINCSAIPATLLEGILFGSTKGSFTGALDRPGLLEQADGGIIYLDEIDSMPLELQPKLLRFLQDWRVRRLGSAVERTLDVKVISSISDIPERVLSDGRLRLDLFYRLAVISLQLPPLRERMDDLNDLIVHFMAKYNVILEKNVKSLDPEVEEMLQLYDWPGNVRELEHVIAGAINLTAWEDVLRIHHIPEHHRVRLERLRSGELNKTMLSWGKPTLGPVDPASPTPYIERPLHSAFLSDQSIEEEAQAAGGAVELSLEEQEANAIRNALQKTHGQMTRAARMLGISRQLLHYKVKKHAINRKEFCMALV